MPLRAYIDGEETISIDLTDEQWNVLKKRLKGKEAVLKLACCGQEGFFKNKQQRTEAFRACKGRYSMRLETGIGRAPESKNRYHRGVSGEWVACNA